jgi:Tol biopolymer transport system component
VSLVRRITLIAAVLATLALVAVTPAQATFPGKNGRIAFARYSDAVPRGDARFIWTINPDGSDSRQLTTPDSIAWPESAYYRWNIWPDWSPDGRKIAFASTPGFFDLWSMNADGTGLKQLTDSDSDEFPTWSPDGNRIAFNRVYYLGSQRSDLWIMDADGSNAHIVSGTAPDYVFEPSWSPDGSRIAYSNLGQIITIRPDGTDRRVVIEGVGGASPRAPDWSPDGTRLAFFHRDDFARDTLYTANADGSSPRRIAENSSYPSWSPDGTKIAFSKYESFPGQSAFIVNADGTDAHVLASTRDSSFTSRPDWAPAPEPRRSDFKNGPAFCRSLRDFLGDAEFGRRYGSSDNAANAFGKCVSSPDDSG